MTKKTTKVKNLKYCWYCIEALGKRRANIRIAKYVCPKCGGTFCESCYHNGFYRCLWCDPPMLQRIK